jgi:predicted AAA+ superfamily ATPase
LGIIAGDSWGFELNSAPTIHSASSIPKELFMAYLPRIIDAELKRMLRITPFLVIEGPKAVGKTESAIQVAKKIIRLDTDQDARRMANIAPEILLAGDTPVLIDEWQLEPSLWGQVKVESDRRKAKGQFILTGSSIPSDDATRDTAAGRVSRLKMRPMSLFESGKSSGEVSLAKLFANANPTVGNPGVTIQEITELICIGGWPLVQNLNISEARSAMKSYVSEIAGIDLQRATGITYNKQSVLKTLKSVARNIGTRVSESKIAEEAGAPENSLDRKTVGSYLQALERVMIVENNPAWTPNLRSPVRLTASPVRYFVDPSIAVAALEATPTQLLSSQINLLGFLFENMVVRDVRIYAQAIEGRVLQYREAKGDEIDLIIESGDGEWAAVEVKLGLNELDNAATKLKTIVNKVDFERTGKPKFMAIITATGSAYRRPDGVFVIPISTLGP